MATAKSDDEADEQQPHPLAHNRPGVYVQVNATPRKRKAERARLEAEAVRAGAHAEGAAASMPEPAEEDAAPHSGVEPSGRPQPAMAREVEYPGVAAARRAMQAMEEAEAYDRVRTAPPPATEVLGGPGADSENTNHRADLMVVPGPPRMPSISLSGAPVADMHHGASLLDAPRSLHPDSIPTDKRSSWALLAAVAVLSGIITAALVVAVRDSTGADEAAARAPAALKRAPPETAARLPEPAPAQPAMQGVVMDEEQALAPSQEVAAPAMNLALSPSAAGGSMEEPAMRAAEESAPASSGAAKGTPAGVAGTAVVVAEPSARRVAPLARKAPLNPAQAIAEHARALAPVQLPTITDTSLPDNPYGPATEE